MGWELGGTLEETCAVPRDDWSQVLVLLRVLPGPSPFPVPLPEAWVWASRRRRRRPQGQSEQMYSTVKTGMPAVTVTNLKPATRYVFQVRAASPGPSWETQSFSPSIEVQTPEEGKCRGSARGTWAGDRWEREYM